MPLVNMKDMLRAAKEGKYAVGHFNVNNLEYVQGILEAAEEEQAPVICGCSEGAGRYMGGYPVVVAMIKAYMQTKNITVPVAIHLDHGSSFESCVSALYAGFTSVMIDGSHYPLDENIALTKRVIDVARTVGASVEAELGKIGGQEDDVVVEDGADTLAVPSECDVFARETGLDCFAPALGSAHGLYKGEPKLNFERMEEIRDLTGLPLVLHGGTGIPEKDIKKAISCGTCKINVNTESQLTFTAKIRELLDADPDLYDPRKYLGPGKDAIKNTVKLKIREFGCNGKA